MVASVFIVAIQESCLKFCASFSAPLKVFSNVKDLVLSLVQSSLASKPAIFFFCHLVGKKDLGFGLFSRPNDKRKNTGWLARLNLKMQVQTSLLVNVVSQQSIPVVMTLLHLICYMVIIQYAYRKGLQTMRCKANA